MESYGEKQNGSEYDGNGVKGINAQNNSAGENDSMKEENAGKPEESKEEEEKEEAQNKGPTKQANITDVIDFFTSNPNPDDSILHNFTEANGFETHQFETITYRLATIAAEFLRGGKMNKSGLDVSQVDPEQLSMGIEIEQEHTPNLAVAKKIALDHLSEMPDYYTRMKQMEDQYKSESGAAAVPKQEGDNGDGNGEGEGYPDKPEGDKVEPQYGGYDTVQEPYTYIPWDQRAPH